MSHPDLAGKHVLITGGAGGIGAAVVQGFVAEGARVTFLDRDGERGRALAARTGARFLEVDLSDYARVAATLADAQAHGGPVRVLVNNAAWDPRHDVMTMSYDEWDALFRLNVGHYFATCRELLPAMIAAGGGSVIMVTSHQVWLGDAGLTCYTATKAAIVGMVRSLAREVGRRGVRVNAIAPGWIMTERQLRERVTPEAQRKLVEEEQILPMLLQPEDVVPVFLFLASDASRAITRQTIVVDAGKAMA